MTAGMSAGAGAAVERLVRIMAQLRGPEGCPWDREQTLSSLRQWLLEETYEVLEVMEADAFEAHRDELGDLLLQVVFQSRIREEAGQFSIADVADAISNKMERRHPHVFGDAVFEDTAAVRRSWAQIKKAEGRSSALDGVPKALPALLAALRLGEKAANVGFDWDTQTGVIEKLHEEQAELEAALAAEDAAAVEGELGDYLFTVVNLCRRLGVDPEAALRGSNQRFDARFRHLERGLDAENKAVADQPTEVLEARWQAAKRALSTQDEPLAAQPPPTQSHPA